MIDRTGAMVAGDEIGGAIAIGRPSGGLPLSILVAPLSDRSGAAFGSQRPLVILFVTDPRRSGGAPIATLRQLYNLTAAEAEVALGVAEGRSVEQIAETRGKSLNTARTQLKAVMAKMGVSRQTDVVRLIVGLANPL
jgi:DNA-binding CsgD family transcriptional regulator